MRPSFWFVPALIVLGAVGLAAVLISVDVNVELQVDKKWPLIFGSGADGARGLLSSIAGSMITVAGVVFSITIVALALTSSQYSSRVLRNLMKDRTNQVVLGVFVGIFAHGPSFQSLLAEEFDQSRQNAEAKVCDLIRDDNRLRLLDFRRKTCRDTGDYSFDGTPVIVPTGQ